MITFLPYPDFVKSADCLDWQPNFNRLNNQVNEVISIAGTLLGIYGDKGWPNHPTTKMWAGCELALVDYGITCLNTWNRKRKTFSQERMEKLVKLQGIAIERPWTYGITRTGKHEQRCPFWFGDEEFHSRHRAILLGKNWNWYKQFRWKEEPAVPEILDNGKKKWPYFWPVR